MNDSAQIVAEHTTEGVLASSSIEAAAQASEVVTYLLNVMDQAGLIRSINQHDGQVSVTFSEAVDSDDLVIGPVGTPAADEALLLRSRP